MMKRAADHIPIEQHVQTHRETLAREKRELLPVLQKKREAMLASQSACTSRRTMRFAADLGRKIEEVEARLSKLESDEHVHEFERKVVPYMEAYVRQSGAPKAKAARFLVPGEASSTRWGGEENGGGEEGWRMRGGRTQTDVVAEYLSEVQGTAPRPTVERDTDLCPRCADTEMVIVPSKALLVCPTCGTSASFLDATSSSISYDESVEMVTFSYKRGNHFQDHLSNCQGVEAYRVPQAVIDAVMMELYKQRVTSLDEITTQRVRGILKGLKQRKSYDHVAQIVSRVTGRPPLRLPPEAAEMCRLMFTAVQVPFQRHCPPTRKNFLSYTFILNKMLHILGYDELCETLNMLKGQDKLKRMDVVWRRIADDLDWPFHETPT